MPSTRITKREIEAARTKAARTDTTVMLWDEDLRGFGCRISPSGKAAWLVKKRLGAGGREGKQIKHVFGDFEELPLDKARGEALKLLADIRNAVHLSERKRETRKAQHKAFNADKLGDAVALFVKRNTIHNRYWHELELRLASGLVAPLGPGRTVESIKRTELRHLIEGKEESYPGGARLLFAAMRPFFKFCVEREIIAASPMDGMPSPKIGPARDRILSDEEIKALWCATEKFELFGPYYRLLLLTAQRRDEVAGMLWGEIDLHERTWTIPKERTKNGKAHLVHLSPQAVTILQDLKRDASSFVFTTTGSTAISGYSRAKAKLDRLIQKEIEGELQPFRIHDLRRTAASGMAKLGFQPHIIERVLNHTSGAQGGLVGVYQRYEYQEERRRALQAWGQYLAQLTQTSRLQDNVLYLNNH